MIAEREISKRSIGHVQVDPRSRLRADLWPGVCSRALVCHDGDTLWHDKKRVQLLGIDAPELSQPCFDAADKIWPCGRYARDHIRHLIASGDVSCTIEGKDRNDDDVGVCFVGSIDLARDLVKHGLAVADKQAPRYLAEERQARMAKHHLWAGQFIDPGDYRRGH